MLLGECGLPEFMRCFFCAGLSHSMRVRRLSNMTTPMVSVADTQDPVFLPGSCPPSQVLNVTQPDQRQVQVNWTAPNATDNRGTPSITSDTQPGSLFNITAAGAAPHVVTYVDGRVWADGAMPVHCHGPGPFSAQDHVPARRLCQHVRRPESHRH
jgi:hypothetical protein